MEGFTLVEFNEPDAIIGWKSPRCGKSREEEETSVVFVK